MTSNFSADNGRSRGVVSQQIFFGPLPSIKMSTALAAFLALSEFHAPRPSPLTQSQSQPPETSWCSAATCPWCGGKLHHSIRTPRSGLLELPAGPVSELHSLRGCAEGARRAPYRANRSYPAPLPLHPTTPSSTCTSSFHPPRA